MTKQLLEVLVGCIHNAPTDERATRIKSATAVEIPYAAIAFTIYPHAGMPTALRDLTHFALQRHFNHIQGIEQCANTGTDDSASYKFLCGSR